MYTAYPFSNVRPIAQAMADMLQLSDVQRNCLQFILNSFELVAWIKDTDSDGERVEPILALDWNWPGLDEDMWGKSIDLAEMIQGATVPDQTDVEDEIAVLERIKRIAEEAIRDRGKEAGS